MGGTGRVETFSLACAKSHSLAALIAKLSVSVGELEQPLNTNLFRSFQIDHRIHDATSYLFVFRDKSGGIILD